MKKEALWQALMDRYPDWQTGVAHFAPSGLSKFYSLVWDTATGEAYETILRESGVRGKSCPDVIKSLFGHFRR